MPGARFPIHRIDSNLVNTLIITNTGYELKTISCRPSAQPTSLKRVVRYRTVPECSASNLCFCLLGNQSRLSSTKKSNNNLLSIHWYTKAQSWSRPGSWWRPDVYNDRYRLQLAAHTGTDSTLGRLNSFPPQHGRAARLIPHAAFQQQHSCQNVSSLQLHQTPSLQVCQISAVG